MVRTITRVLMVAAATLCLPGSFVATAQQLAQMAILSSGTELVAVGTQDAVYSCSLPVTTTTAKCTQIPGTLVKVSGWGEMWGINKGNDLFRFDSTSKQWVEMETDVLLVSVVKSASTLVLALKGDGSLMSWDGTGWTTIGLAPNGGALTGLAAGSSLGMVYGVNSSGAIYKLNGSKWVGIKGSLKTISVGEDGTIGGMGLDGLAYVRTAADVAAELSGAKTTPLWLAPEELPTTTPASIEVLTEQVQLLILTNGTAYRGPASLPVFRAGQTVTEGYACILGTVEISGVCRDPTLLPTLCSPFINQAPENNEPCCEGLVKTGGVCVRNTIVNCTASEIATCCYGTTLNDCSCYCPSNYYVGN